MAETRGTAGTPRKGRGHGGQRLPPQPATRPKRLAFTLDLNTGQIIRVEGVDAENMRHDLSQTEMTVLRSDTGRPRVETLLEEAFEAGIACILGGGSDETTETDGDAGLRQMILKPLMDDSAAARLMKSDVLNQAIVETLIEHALLARRAAPKGEPQDSSSNGSASTH
jgi:hypothetical protein